MDCCFDAGGIEIASGENAWDGILDDNLPGACAEEFPIYSTSRIVACGPFKGSVSKCHLMPVADVIASGIYGVWTPAMLEQYLLEQIFFEGVCDFEQPDAGLPVGW